MTFKDEIKSLLAEGAIEHAKENKLLDDNNLDRGTRGTQKIALINHQLDAIQEALLRIAEKIDQNC